MITKYYKCTLLSDAIMNQSLATAGNLETLDYIPGSVFLGIIAQDIYKKIDKNGAYRILHNGEVKFGDGLVTDNERLSYHYPLLLYKDKLENDSNEYLHHLLNEENYPRSSDDYKIQLKQIRAGYFSVDGKANINVAKSFSIKSARDRATRKSKDKHMFGYESINAGQSFIFPITYMDVNDQSIVEEALLGEKRVGKSKTAEYSLAKIERIDNELGHRCEDRNDYTLVYVHSNLCLIDEYGQPNLQPTANDLGVKGRVDWAKSQIRIYEYTSWNGKRNTPNAQRHCIARGSVFYVQGANGGREDFVGEYQAEGLGRILVNPNFLFSVNVENRWGMAFKEERKGSDENKKISTPLPIETVIGRFLKQKKDKKEAELLLSKEIVDALKIAKGDFARITKSQWGSIRNYATNAVDRNDLFNKLFKDKEGYLTHGVAFDRYWNKDNNLEKLKSVISNKSPEFVAKFAAQMAKEKQK